MTVDINQVVFTPAECAELLRCRRKTIYEMIRSGELPSFKLGGA